MGRLEGERGAEIRELLRHELERDGFAPRHLALTTGEIKHRLRCDAVDRACVRNLGRWLRRSEATSSRYAVLETNGPPERSIIVCDLEDGALIDAFVFREDTGDLVLPIVAPRAIATSIREHDRPPPPPTEAERREIALLEEPPRIEEAEACVCLSVMPDGPYPHNTCPAEYGPPPLQARGCSVGRPSRLFVLLALFLLIRRRRETIDRLAVEGCLPPDVARRLS